MIEIDTIKKSLTAGYQYIKRNSGMLDNLNVFPVPDGDTGFNMSSTIKAGLDAANKKKYKSIGQFFRDFSNSSLRTSRGNSGVLIARFLMGIAEVSIEE
ncbi:MAG: DAK2 domain-containing protein, partial [Actinomycetia bacterium]|nr:DAK2 domain-containing protein [Actinomycetes bacterium]